MKKTIALTDRNFWYPIVVAVVINVVFFGEFRRYSSMAMGGVTLLLGFNLLRKGVAASEVSKLSNTGDDSIRCDGACSSASADSIAAVAENRRPSTVTVLQTWSCPIQGKEFSSNDINQSTTCPYCINVLSVFSVFLFLHYYRLFVQFQRVLICF